MTTRRRLLLLPIAFLALCGGVASADTAADPMTRDLLMLSDWFEGSFDNEEQRWFEADPRSNTDVGDRVVRVHVMHRRIALPAFGEHVFYVEEYKEDNPEDIIRQRLVIFSSLPEQGRIRMQQGFFKNADAVSGGYADSSLLDNIEADDVMFLSECDVFWRRVADQFAGEMQPKHCVFGEGDERRYSMHDLILSQNKYWRVDSTFLVADDTLFRGYAADRPIKMRRALPFSCQVFFYADDGSAERLDGLPIHSQGGMITATRESDGEAFDVLMRTKEYPYYDTRPDFIYFSIRRSGELRSIAFSVNDVDSRTLGMRTKEVGAFCHREGYQFQETLDEL